MDRVVAWEQRWSSSVITDAMMLFVSGAYLVIADERQINELIDCGLVTTMVRELSQYWLR